MAKKKDEPEPKGQAGELQPYFSLLGLTARDRITGFSGVIVTVSFDLFGCAQVIIRPPANKDGKLDDAHLFDVNRLEINVSKERAMPVPSFAPLPAQHDKGPAADRPLARTV